MRLDPQAVYEAGFCGGVPEYAPAVPREVVTEPPEPSYLDLHIQVSHGYPLEGTESEAQLTECHDWLHKGSS